MYKTEQPGHAKFVGQLASDLEETLSEVYGYHVVNGIRADSRYIQINWERDYMDRTVKARFFQNDEELPARKVFYDIDELLADLDSPDDTSRTEVTVLETSISCPRISITASGSARGRWCQDEILNIKDSRTLSLPEVYDFILRAVAHANKFTENSLHL
jgi:hypothetical protein